ncbi:hypothetical protein AVANS14531_04905 [Campylobacter sp. Cr9]|uniref:hypothetical protein n=1 Tax=Campylobacter sp. Cr9 TaxID=2735728 RepID=UPI0030142CD2|nr:hypothetical protein [Campylobacter sp. Cr9]
MKKFLYSLFFIALIQNNAYSNHILPTDKCSFFVKITYFDDGSPYEVKLTLQEKNEYIEKSENAFTTKIISHSWIGATYNPEYGCNYKEQSYNINDFVCFKKGYYYNANFGYHNNYNMFEYSESSCFKSDNVYLFNDNELGFQISAKDEEVEKTINDLDANSRKAYACAVSGMGNYTGVTLDYLGGALASLKNKNGISFKNLLLGAKGLSSIISSTPLNNKKAVACAIRCSGGDLKINEGINSSSMCSEKSISDYDSSVNSAPIVEISELSELEKKAIQTTYNNCVINYDTCMLEASKNDESYYNQLSDKDKALIDSLLGEYENSQILIRDDENNVIGAINNGSLVAGTLDENGLFIEDKKDIVVTLPNVKDEELVLPNENDGVAVSPDISIPNNKEENDKIQLPNEITKPNEDVGLGEVVKPNEITKPNEDVNVGEVVKPNEITKPNEDVNVGEVVKPNEITKPNEAVKPDEVVITKPNTEVSINKENSKVNVDVNVKVDDITIKLDDNVSFVDDLVENKLNNYENQVKETDNILNKIPLSEYIQLFDKSFDNIKELAKLANSLELKKIDNYNTINSCPRDFSYSVSNSYHTNGSYDICKEFAPSYPILHNVFRLIFLVMSLISIYKLSIKFFK